MKENKRLICELLADVIRQTMAGEDVEDIQYITPADGIEVASVYLKNGVKMGINVTADSGIAMIRDILRVF